MYLLRSYFKSLRAILYLKFILSRKPMAIVDKNNIEKIKILYLTSNVPKFELCIFFFFFVLTIYLYSKNDPNKSNSTI